MKQEIYVRAHIVTPRVDQSQKRQPEPIWPRRILVFDTETTIDEQQDLTFGAFRLCQLKGGKYITSEEGLFYRDDLDDKQLKILQQYVRAKPADIEVKSFPPRLDLKLYPRWEFVEKVFWKAIKDERMIVCFNLPFDISRLAVDWRVADNGGWSLILSHRPSRETGEMEPNPHRPRVRITAKDSKTAFIALMKSQNPEEWPRQSRFLDVHTLAFSLFAESLSLENMCKKLKVPGKLNHEPTGRISIEEIDYCRGDVRATTAALNALKVDFDRHALDLRPDLAYSPASIAKAYLRGMGIQLPKDKFAVPDRINGIAMQAYFGGRAECRIRHCSVPVVHTDFTSQYPTVNTLLGNWGILTAESISFDLATDEIREFLQGVTLERTFDRKFWKDLNFFALVQPNEDILPVRTVYNGQTQNIGINKLSSDTPIWFAGPDIVSSVLLTGKVPEIIEAIRMVPHGKQKGLRPISLYGSVNIDPCRDDLFRSLIEQRGLQRSDSSLKRTLKTLANAGSYGLFVEVTPDDSPKDIVVDVFSGHKHFQQSGKSFEKHGKWYFPPIASLITAGGRLLLAMLEKSITDIGGTYLFCDTDSMCIVATESGGAVDCKGLDGAEQIHALSWREVESIRDRFKGLNPYDPKSVSNLLKIEDVNFDSEGKQRSLFGYAISAKRYALYEHSGDDLKIIDAKGHGLGYLYPPIDRREGGPEWTFAAWDWLLRQALGLPIVEPVWLNRPAMMKICVSTPNILRRLKSLRPYNFVLCPLIDGLCGFPAGIDREQFTLIAPFSKNHKEWLSSKYVNIHDGKYYSLAFRQTPRLDKVIPKTIGQILRIYPLHPENKSLAPDGNPCNGTTQGLLQRMHVYATKLRYIGKETDRKWDHGGDISLLMFRPAQFDELGKMVKADQALIEQLAEVPIKTIARKAQVDRNTIRKICRGGTTRHAVIQRLVLALKELVPMEMT